MDRTLLLVFLVAAVAGENYDSRLTGTGGNRGTLEVLWDGTWRNICPDVFDTNAAMATCRGIGYSYFCKETELDVHDLNGQLERTFLNAEPQCGGWESSLAECSWQNITLPDSCYNRTRTTVLTCANSTDVEIRLIGGALPSEGVPEVRCNTEDNWSIFCYNEHWDVRDCRIICRQLGYKTCTAWSSTTSYNHTGRDVLFSQSYCGGVAESNILECPGERDQSQCNLDVDGISWMSCGHEVNISGEDVLLCGSQHTCTNRCGDWQQKEGCQCDHLCREFNDCCVDYEDVCEAIDESDWPENYLFNTLYRPEDYACINAGEDFSSLQIVAVARCPSVGVGEGTRRLCEGDFNATDVMATIPVVDTQNNTFKNIFCAICHGYDVEDVSVWDLVVPYVMSQAGQLPHHEILDVDIPEGGFFVPQPHPWQRYRWCSSNLLSADVCDSEYRNTSLAHRCEQYFAPIAINYVFDRPTFKNPDCRKCEGYIRYLDPPMEAIYCAAKPWRCFGPGHFPCRVFLPLTLRPDAFISVEFNYSRLAIYEENAGHSCSSEGLVYDPFLDVCRVLKCPNYHQLVEGKCVPSEVPPGDGPEFRLSGISDSHGRVELKHIETWYSACAEFFNANVSRVICRQLGYDDYCTYSKGRPNSFESPKAMDPYTVDIICTGEENLLSECQTAFTFDNFTRCPKIESEVIVSCMNYGDVEVRMIGSPIEPEGFLQARCGGNDADWAYFNTGEYGWSQENGQVACSMLGYDTFAYVAKRELTETDIFPVVNREMNCAGSEDDLFLCPYMVVSAIPEDGRYAFLSCGFEASILNEEVFLCGSHHTCVGRCGSWKEGCSCDDLCEHFDDCCFDYHQVCYDQKQQQQNRDEFSPFPRKIHSNQYECHDFTNVHIFVVSKCSPYWIDDFVKSACQQEQFPKDLISRTPVYDRDGVVYRNRYCALCNDVPPNLLTAYRLMLKLNISGNPQTTILFGGITFPEDDFSTARTCFITPDVCRHSDINLCLVYHAPTVLDYRNPSCLACEKLAQDFYCQPLTCNSVHPACDGPKTAPLLELFDFSVYREAPQKRCNSSLGELFDPFLQICRFMGCPDGYFYSLGRCVEGDLPYGAPQVVLKTTLQESMECIKSSLSMNEMEIEELYVTPISKNLTANGPFLVSVVSESLLASFSVKLTLDSLLLSISGRYDIYYKCATATFLLLINQTFNNITEEDCYGGDISFEHKPAELTYSGRFQNVFSYEYDTSTERFDRHDLTDACWDSLNFHLECSEKSVINPREFVLSPSRSLVSVTVYGTEITLSTGEFEMMRNGSLRACSDRLLVANSLYEVLYIICVVISLIALLCTFITYQTFPKLRNVPGLCLMNLIAALFVANLLFLFIREMVHFPTVCAIIAASSHFTWLASFAWMSVLSFHMARTLGTLSMQPHTVVNTRKAVSKYCIYAWGMPALITALSLIMHFCNKCKGDFVFQYGGTEVCWIDDGLAVLVTVGLPIGTMLLFDLALFLYIGISLRKTRYSTKHMRTNSALANDLLVELAVNTRLFILLGITWIFGFIQEFWPIPVWQIIFLVSNSLQGLFIFVMFVMKKRVLKMWRDVLFTCRKEEPTPTTKEVDDQPKEVQGTPAVISQH